MKDFVIISCQPSDMQFWWQIKVQLNNFRKLGYSQYYRILVFISHDKISGGVPQMWKDLAKEYPESKFFFYMDTENFLKIIQAYYYIPLLRPHMLYRHWMEHKELETKSVLYIDSDIVFTKALPIEDYLKDDTCYLSNTQSYNAASYFDSKVKDVLPERLSEYMKKDVLEEASKKVGASRKLAVENELNTGGAQYLLKNIKASFWNDVLWGCCHIITYLRDINRRFFESENKGFQSWATDMYSVLWNLWAKGYETRTPEWMDFAWATDPIDKWERVYIYHDAGAPKDGDLFYKHKGDYVNNIITPLQDDLSFVNKNFCSYNYVKAIEDTKN